MLTKAENIDPATAEDVQDGVAAAGESGETSVRHNRRDELDDDEDNDNTSLLEELLNGEDETYDHIRGDSINFSKCCCRNSHVSQSKMFAHQKRPGGTDSDYEKSVWSNSSRRHSANRRLMYISS